jgi:hypothetical protein
MVDLSEWQLQFIIADHQSYSFVPHMYSLNLPYQLKSQDVKAGK